MARAIQFREREAAQPAITPELKEFVDRCLVPILVRECLLEIERENSLALAAPPAQDSHSTATRSASGGETR